MRMFLPSNVSEKNCVPGKDYNLPLPMVINMLFLPFLTRTLQLFYLELFCMRMVQVRFRDLQQHLLSEFFARFSAQYLFRVLYLKRFLQEKWTLVSPFLSRTILSRT